MDIYCDEWMNKWREVLIQFRTLYNPSACLFTLYNNKFQEYQTRQIDRQIGRQVDRQINIQIKNICRQNTRQKRYVDRQLDKWLDRQTER